MEKAQMPQAFYAVKKPTPVKRPNNRKKKCEVKLKESEQDNLSFGKFTPFYTLDTLNAVGGGLANYYIRVFARQNASMQGLLVDSESDNVYAASRNIAPALHKI